MLADEGDDVEKGYAHIAGQQYVAVSGEADCLGWWWDACRQLFVVLKHRAGRETLRQYMVDKCCGGAFALGASDADTAVGIYLEKEVALRGDDLGVTPTLELHHGYARRFEYEVIGVIKGIDYLSVVTSHYNVVVGYKLAQQGMGATPLTAVACY